ncbi:MAG: hypothetical protein CFH01_01624 [Alphaproteobacteria bacterium MarineAlpha2_Bin1]|nr:MAG: hypothetical protein CFH01_01624 [Alphaproteobacteria bacterium MarineAlpha2_Bin1]
MQVNKAVSNNFFELAKRLQFTSKIYKKLKLISTLILNQKYISTVFKDIIYNDYFNANRWNTTRGDSSCCC